MTDLLAGIIDWYMLHINYGTVVLLMTIESSFIPFPSEVVVPPAAWKAAEGEMNVVLVVVAATFGAILGALVNYFLALWLGRPVLYRLADTRWAHMLLISPESLDRAEAYFVRHGRSSTFVGRLVPAIRQLISIPAGLARMPMAPFLFYTTLGAGLWNIVLAALGYFLYSQRDLLERYYHVLSYAFAGLALCFVGYLVMQGVRGRKEASEKVT